MYKLLVVEDEDIIRKGLLYTIKWSELNCSIVGEARNGVEGEEAIRQMQPDIVIADITMPVKDGLEMIRDTIEEFDYAAIILSGYSEFEYAKSAIEYGVTAYLLKPLNTEELKKTILSAQKKIEERRRYRGQREEVLKTLADEAVGKMLEYLKKHYSEKILMSDLEKYCNYSGVVLNRRFKAQTGSTFNEYLNRYRIHMAVSMLRGGVSVHEVSTVCGFSEYKYFNTVFRKYVGYSPKDFIAILHRLNE